MAIYTSKDYCTSNSSGYEGLFEHDRGTEQIVIKDPLISDPTVAEARARAELLNGGYVERVVNVVSIHIPTLKQNDIFTFKGVEWIAKEITLTFKPPKLTQSTKGVRYE